MVKLPLDPGLWIGYIDTDSCRSSLSHGVSACCRGRAGAGSGNPSAGNSSSEQVDERKEEKEGAAIRTVAAEST